VLVPGATGVTRLTETDCVTVVTSFAAGPPFPLAPITTVNVAVFAPGGRPKVVPVTTRVMPEVGNWPEEGDTEKYGLSTLAENVVAADCPGMNTFIRTSAPLPSGTVTSPWRPLTVGTGCTTTATGIEFVPTAPPHVVA